MQLQEELADEDAQMMSEEALQPLKEWQQGRQSQSGRQQDQQPSERTAFTREEQQSAPKGYFSRQSSAAQDAGPGHEVSASQHTTEAGSWTTGDANAQGRHTYERQASDTARRAQQSEMGQGAMQNTGDFNVSLIATCC